MRFTRLAAAAVGVLALTAPAYAQGLANHSAGASGMLGGGCSNCPMPRPAGFQVHPGTYGYNPGYISAVGTFSQPAYRAIQYHNGQRVEGIVSGGVFYATTGTKTTALVSKPKTVTRDARSVSQPRHETRNTRTDPVSSRLEYRSTR